MKIYIKNLNINIFDNILDKINKYLLKSEIYIEIYSYEGIFKINNSDIKKQIIIDEEIKIINNYFEEYTIIFDKSYLREELVTTIPFEHINRKIKKCIFKIKEDSMLEIVIESEELDDKSFKVNDMYFEINKNIDINESFIKEEIIVFLSLLN